ncbi:syntaxin [Chloropicon primus]|uniref:Syntaxin n=1 Tax=Chloropicon primus TaxID=1764295 RepID=A0A5B8MT89_9CHLO|nr:syntaxin [Chloropicon primus]UPR02824.1 syntaxin [Chloropicon primus]|eukprot:QDZ23611.1 syntaxin [Chloropicon primus]
MSFTDVAGGGTGGDWTHRAARGLGPKVGDEEVKPSGGMDTALDVLEKTERMAFQLTTKVASYKRMVDRIGTRKDTEGHRAKVRAMGEEIGILAKEAVHELRGYKAKGKRAKTSQNKLLKDIQNVLADFQQAQRLCAEKRSASEPVKTPVKRSKSRRSRAATNNADSERPLLEEEREDPGYRLVQEQMAVEGELEHNNAILTEREEDIKEIQFQIGEVTEIFQDLAVLVSEQGEVIDDVESNIVSTYDRTEEANKELKKAAKHQKAARMQLCTIFMILVVGLIVLCMVLGLFK